MKTEKHITEWIFVAVLLAALLWSLHQRDIWFNRAVAQKVQLKEASSTVGRLERLNTRLLVDRLKLREELAAEKRVKEISDQKILDRVNQIIIEDLKKQGE